MRRDGTAKRQMEPAEGETRGVALKPIRVVVRELTRPDGKKLRVEVPVYPPFQLEPRGLPPAEPEVAPDERSAPVAPARKPKEPRARRRRA